MIRSFLRRQIANIITLSRIVGVFFIFWLTPFTDSYAQLLVILLYIAVSATDFLDGFLARKLKIESDFGKIFDPLADKILVLVFLPLLQMQVITAFPVFIILAREFGVMAIRVFSAKHGTIVQAGFSGKLKTALTLPLCGLLLGRVHVAQVEIPLFLQPLEYLRLWVMTWPKWVLSGYVALVVLVTLWSFIDYLASFVWRRFVQGLDGDEEKAKRLLRTVIPNTFTLLNLACGIAASVMAWMGYFHSTILLICCGLLFDAIDGPLARKLDAFSQLGARFDSKADWVSFGFAPAIVIYRLFSNVGTYWIWVGAVLGLIYLASVHFRLKRFDKTGHTDTFSGLPSPIGAAIVLDVAMSNLSSYLPIFLGFVVGAAFLMSSTIQYPHLEALQRIRITRIMVMVLLPIMFVLTMMNVFEIYWARQAFVFEIFLGPFLIYLTTPIWFKNR